MVRNCGEKGTYKREKEEQNGNNQVEGRNAAGSLDSSSPRENSELEGFLEVERGTPPLLHVSRRQ